MVNEADKYREEDEKQRQKVEARNKLENYLFQVKQATSDAADDKLSSEDKETVKRLCDECIKWMDNNSMADKEEFEYKLEEIQKKVSPIMVKLHGGSKPGQGQSGGGEHAGSEYCGPTIEEMD